MWFDRRFLQDEDGSTAIEYALLASMMSIVLIGGLLTFGTSVVNMFNSVSTQVVAASPGG